MKQVFVSTAFAMAFAVMAVGCAGETAGPSSETGSVNVNLIVGNTDVTAVAFEVECDSGITLNGNFNVVDDREPPIWATIMDLPVGICTVTLIAQDAAGATLCTASENVEVLENQTVKVDLVLVCEEDAEEALGNIEIDATFEIIEGNLCPRLHFLNAVPINVPTSGSEVTVLVSDGDNDPLTTALTATGGSFLDPAAQLTTYTCDGAAGAQTIFVTVTDGNAACDKSKSFDVVCPGVDPCEGVECPDTGNECTVGICTDQSAPDCEETNVANGIACNAGGGGELAVNGDFEQGAGLPGWTLFCDTPGASCEATTAEAQAGSWSGNVAVEFQGAGAVDAVIKNANIGIGTVQPNSSCDVSFDLKGSAGDGGVVFVEFFSELTGGGTSSSVILLGPPTFPTGTWTNYSFNTPTGFDVSGGVTVQLKASCGPVPNCAVDAFFDNVSVNCGGSGGEAGTCQEGVCEPDDLCEGVDCNDNNECTVDTCDAGNCSNTPDTGASCDGGAGTCDVQGVCQANDLCEGVDCNDNNECTIDTCDAGSCSNTPDSGASCDGGAGTCDAQGVCQANANCEYTQDFEGLDQASATALSDDGWIVFGNVFSPDGGTFLYGYGTDPAPNNTGAFSGIALGEGGGPQGAQVLVIISDYNNGDQNIGNRIEANTFRERIITAADVGTTLTFSFDAKRGNINDPSGNSTANAFIKTLTPTFNLVSFEQFNSTAIDPDWMRYEVSLAIDGGQLGNILQIGFSATAANFEPSGVFYDNLEACSAPTP